jgi:polyhydroxybutyrate depolymerase
MNKLLLTFCFAASVLASKAQTTIIDSIFTGGQYRSYRLYVPAIYTGATARPLILNLHGYTSNAQQQQLYSNFMPIADTANFLMVFPNGTYSSGQRFWNAGISPFLVNDIDFLSALIDSLDLQYNIDLNRVYSCGMSNGGYMSHTLACELSNRITAIASVTGSIFNTQYGANCHVTRPVPVMQIHGTADPTVPYAGSSSSMPIDSVVKYWVNKDGCSPVATFSNVPNISTTDGCTAEHYLYSGGLSGSTVEFFKIIGGLHTWPGFPFGGSGTNMDMDASKEIWRFFNKYRLNVLTSVSEVDKQNSGIRVFPNPASQELYIKDESGINIPLFAEITDVLGKTIISGAVENNSISLNVLETGVYFISVQKNDREIIKQRFVKL